MVLASRWPQLAAYFSSFGMPVAIVDLESTGGNLFEDRVTEIAVLRFENGTVRHHEWLVNPQQPISPFIARLTGIDNDMVADAPVFADLADTLLPLLRGTLLVAHNSRFDYTFLRHEFQRAGRRFAAPALCTVQLSRRLYPQYHKHNLDSIIERFQIDAAQRHRAMADVLALADFLEKSLADTESEWQRHFHALPRPQRLPLWLPKALSQQIYALPDTYGITVWRDKNGKTLDVRAHEKTFSEISAAVQKETCLPYLRGIGEMDFIPAVGRLHALWLKAQRQSEAGTGPSENNVRYLTVQFAADETERLQARIVALGSGAAAHPPTGLFLHKKAAKRALSAWASEHGLCPASLDILPESHARNVPCPVQAVGGCDGSCRTESGTAEQNRRICSKAALLPVADWGRARRITVTESDALSGQTVRFNCAGGALELPDGRWYFDPTLPALLKEKFKLGGKAVHITEAV